MIKIRPSVPEDLICVASYEWQMPQKLLDMFGYSGFGRWIVHNGVVVVLVTICLSKIDSSVIK